MGNKKNKIQELNEALIAAKEEAEELSKTFTMTGQAVDSVAMTSSNMALGGGGNVYNTPSTGIGTFGGTGTTFGGLWPATTPGLEWGQMDTCPTGHVANTEDVEYVDGVIVSHCITCNARMTLNKVSGGVALLRIQHLLGRVMSIDEETQQLEGFDLGQILSDFSEIRDSLEKDEFALRQARKLFDLAAQVLNTKVSSEEG